MVDYSDINPFNVGNFVGVEFMTPAITSASLFEALSQGIGGTPARLSASRRPDFARPPAGLSSSKRRPRASERGVRADIRQLAEPGP
jgi:hypothetical protein